MTYDRFSLKHLLHHMYQHEYRWPPKTDHKDKAGMFPLHHKPVHCILHTIQSAKQHPTDVYH